MSHDFATAREVLHRAFADLRVEQGMSDVVFFPDEEWLEILADPTYLVSTYGRLYDTRDRRIVRVSTLAHLPLSWSLRAEGISRNRYIACATTVLKTFRGDGSGYRVAYLDGNPENFALTNLRWI
jgi:hypothetical protein